MIKSSRITCYTSQLLASLLIFCFFCASTLQAQRTIKGLEQDQPQEESVNDYTMEYGLGIGIQNTGFSLSNDANGTIADTYKNGNNLSMQLRAAYKINPRIKASLALGFSWRGSTGDPVLPVNQTLVLRGRYIDVPLQLHVKIIDKLSIHGGLEYSYLLNLTFNDVPSTNFADNRHLLGYRVGIYTTINNLFEIGLNTYSGLNDLNTITLTDELGAVIGENKFRNREFQLSVVMRK